MARERERAVQIEPFTSTIDAASFRVYGGIFPIVRHGIGAIARSTTRHALISCLREPACTCVRACVRAWHATLATTRKTPWPGTEFVDLGGTRAATRCPPRVHFLSDPIHVVSRGTRRPFSRYTRRKSATRIAVSSSAETWLAHPQSRSVSFPRVFSARVLPRVIPVCQPTSIGRSAIDDHYGMGIKGEFNSGFLEKRLRK